MSPGLFFHKLSFKPPFRQIKEAMRVARRARNHEAWCRHHVKGFACQIDPSIEIRDDRPVTPENIFLGKGTVIERDCTLWLGKEPNSLIHLGERVYLGRNCFLGAIEPLEIGTDTLIGAYSYIITANHVSSDVNTPVRTQGYVSKPIRIGSDVWIGSHVVILPGVTIGNKAIIGAGAIVTKSVGEREIWVGNPAKFTGKYRGER